jgi:hypothetical protein
MNTIMSDLQYCKSEEGKILTIAYQEIPMKETLHYITSLDY